MLNPAKKLTLIISTLIFVAFLLSGYAWLNYKQDKNLEVIFFDVGQGDSILIRTPDKQNILIDGGPDATVVYKLGKYLPFYDKIIDLMILTHPHSDHVAGLVDVLTRYRVKRVLGTGVTHTSADYLKWLELIKEKEIKFITAAGYRKIIFSENGKDEVILEILYPLENISPNSFKDLNGSSVVVKLTYGSNSFLFTGDLPVEGEEKLVKSDDRGSLTSSVEVKFPRLKANVLKVGHHGSKFSSSLEFLEQVQPAHAVIQVGKNNKFNHPHIRTLRNLEKVGAQILRNDELDDIIFIGDGEKLGLK
jgi:competence protein ComEC